jgi:hypothetical protein
MEGPKPLFRDEKIPRFVVLIFISGLFELYYKNGYEMQVMRREDKTSCWLKGNKSELHGLRQGFQHR